MSTMTRVLLPAVGAVVLSTTALSADRSDVQTLPALRVEAEVPAEQVDGFVATQSATGSKTTANIVELPRAVSVVTADEIRNRGADSINEVFQYTAGINGDAYGGQSLSRVYSNVRGFLSYQYLDGLKLHDSSWGIEAFALESAELLKGPASSLYGQASPGGLLNLTSKRPQYETSREVLLQAGTFNRFQGAVDLTGPIGDGGKLAYRVVALARDSDTGVQHTRDDRYYVAPAVAWQPSERVSLTVLGAFQYDPNLTAFQYLPRVGTVDRSAHGYVPRDTFTGEPGFDDLHIRRLQIGYLLGVAITDRLAFRQNLRYTDLDITARYLQAGAVAANQRTVSRTAVNSGYDIQVSQVDSQLDYLFDIGAAKHDALVGIDYAWIPTLQISGTATGPTLDLYTPVYGTQLVLPVITTSREQNFRQLGVYLQDQAHIGPVTVLGGLRRDRTASITDSRNPVTNVTSPRVSQRDDDTSGQLGISVRFPHGVTPYANYARSFQPTIGSDFAGNAFLPSTGSQWEVGLKMQPRTGTLLTLAYFDLVQQNVRTSDLAHPGFSIQIGEVSSKGVEFEAKTSMSRSLNLTGAYTYLDNTVTRSTTSTLGKRPTGRPVHQASLWVDYALPRLPGLVIGGGVRYVGSSYGDTNNTFEVPAYTLVDTLLRYDWSKWSAALNASNVFDRRYVVNCDAATQCFYGQGGTGRVTLSRKW